MRTKLTKDKILTSIKKSDLINHTFILLSGTVIAQIFVLIAYPILSRLYSPTDFGTYAIFLNIVNILQVITTGRYDLTIILPKKNKDAKSLFIATLIVGLLLVLLYYILLLAFNQSILALLKSPELNVWIWLIPISIYMICVFQVTNYWLTRNRLFKQISYLKIVQTVSIALLTLVIGFCGVKTGQILGYFIGNTLMILYCFYLLNKNKFFQLKTSCLRVWENIKKYKDFPIYNSIPYLASAASASIPVFYINSFFGTQIVGFVNLARQIILIPILFISSSFSQVYLEKLAKSKNEGKLIYNDLKKIIKVLFLMALVFFLLASSCSFWIFQYIFGESWKEAGIYASIMAISASIQFIVSPLGVICITLDRIKANSAWQMLLFILISSLYFAKSLSPLRFFILYIGVEAVAYLIYFIIIVFIAKNYDKKISA